MKEIKITCSGSDLVPIDSLHEFQGNLKTLDAKNYQKLKSSIEKYGFCFPVFVWRNGKNNILDGHQRLSVVKKMLSEGYSIPENKVPVAYIEAKDEKEAKKKVLLATSQYAKTTGEGLLEFLTLNTISFDDIKMEIDIPQINLDHFEDQFLHGDIVEDEVPPVPTKATSTPGEVYRLGRHRLMCGDSTKKEDVEKLMDGKKAEVIFTSPPYSDIRTYGGNKNLDVNHLVAFIPAWSNFTNYYVVNLGIKREKYEVIEYWQEYISAAKQNGFKLLSWNVWDKKYSCSIGQYSAMFPIRHEWLFVFGKSRKKLNKIVRKKDGSIRYRGQTTRRQRDGSMRYTTLGNVSDSYKTIESVTVSDVERGKITTEHPAIFPVDLPKTYIQALTNVDDIVVDSFGGSGSTLIAAEQTGRTCYMMEIFPAYCDVIRTRYKNFVENKK